MHQEIKVPEDAKIIIFNDPYMLELVKTGFSFQPDAQGEIDETNEKGVFRVSRTLHSGERMVEYVKIVNDMENSNNDSDLKLRIKELEGIIENLNKSNSRLSKEVELINKDYHSMVDFTSKKTRSMALLMNAADDMEIFMTKNHSDERCLQSYLQAKRDSTKKV